MAHTKTIARINRGSSTLRQISCVYVPDQTGADTSWSSIDDSKLQTYLSDHPELFVAGWVATLSSPAWPPVPSADDLASHRRLAAAHPNVFAMYINMRALSTHPVFFVLSESDVMLRCIGPIQTNRGPSNRCTMVIEGITDKDPLAELPGQLDTMVYGAGPSTGDTADCSGAPPSPAGYRHKVPQMACDGTQTSHQPGPGEPGRVDPRCEQATSTDVPESGPAVHAAGVSFVREWFATRKQQTSPISPLSACMTRSGFSNTEQWLQAVFVTVPITGHITGDPP